MPPQQPAPPNYDVREALNQLGNAGASHPVFTRIAPERRRPPSFPAPEDRGPGFFWPQNADIAELQPVAALPREFREQVSSIAGSVSIVSGVIATQVGAGPPGPGTRNPVRPVIVPAGGTTFYSPGHPPGVGPAVVPPGTAGHWDDGLTVLSDLLPQSAVNSLGQKGVNRTIEGLGIAGGGLVARILGTGLIDEVFVSPGAGGEETAIATQQQQEAALRTALNAFNGVAIRVLRPQWADPGSPTGDAVAAGGEPTDDEGEDHG